MIKPTPLPPLEEVQDQLDYDPDTGVFRWKATVKRSGITPGARVGYNGGKRGQLHIKLAGRQLQAHRLAWLLQTGEDPGDSAVTHINGQKGDNRFANLRLVKTW